MQRVRWLYQFRTSEFYDRDKPMSAANLVVSCDGMHELSIAMSLVELASEEKERRKLPDVLVVHLRLGSRSGIVRDALEFSFDLATAGTSIEGAALKVEETSGQELELFALEVAG